MRRHVRRARRHVPGVGGVPFQLEPPGDSSAQTVADFTGSNTGHLHTGHLIWLPDQVTYDGANWSYTDGDGYPVIYMHGGQGATPTTTANNTLPTFKNAIGNGQLPPCIIVFPNTEDSDGEEGWGMNAADGSFPLENMLRYDLPAYLIAHTRAAGTAAKSARVGFSKGCFETLRFRAKFDGADCGVYVCMGGPRLDADFPTPAATYTSFTAAEKTKLFGDSTAVLQTQSPIAHTAGTGLFNVYGAGTAPLLMLESDDGAGADGDTTTRNSMNNAITQLGTLTVPFSTANLWQDAVAGDPDHVASEYMVAWLAQSETDGTGAEMDLSWIRVKGGAGWALP
jgi:hypothetical protein